MSNVYLRRAPTRHRASSGHRGSAVCLRCEDDAESKRSASTHRPLSSSFFGLPYRILNISRKKGTT